MTLLSVITAICCICCDSSPSDFSPDPVDVTSWMSFQLLFWHVYQRNEWKAPHSDISTPPTLSYIWFSSLSFLLSHSDFVSGCSTSLNGLAAMCHVCVMSHNCCVETECRLMNCLYCLQGRWEGLLSVRVTGLSSDQNALDYLSCISQQPRLVPEIRHKHLSIFLAASPALVFICCLSNVIVREGKSITSIRSIYIYKYVCSYH